MLTQTEVSEFKRLVFQVYGIKLSDNQVIDQGSRLIMLFEAILKSKRIVNAKKKVIQSNE